VHTRTIRITGTVLQDIRFRSTQCHCAMLKLVSGVLWVQRGILGSVFVWDRLVDTDVLHALTSFVNTCPITEEFFFKKDSATAHITCNSVRLQSVLGNSIIKGLRPHSPELNPCCRLLLVGHVNPLTPNGHYSGRTAPLTSRRCILNIYSTNTRTEYFKHAA
jgi:hypothetical protein